jgi:nicotinamidase-related amidase
VSVLIDLHAYTNPAAVPTFVLVDLQQEYISPPRGLALGEARLALENCAKALATARSVGLPIAHVRWSGRSSFFNTATPFANWIDGFSPFGSEMVFERSRPSCYANKHFADIMNESDGGFVLAGFAGESACLSTMVDAFHRNHRVTFLFDASASHALDEFDPSVAHRMVVNVVRNYGRVLPTQDWIESLGEKMNKWKALHAYDERSA